MITVLNRNLFLIKEHVGMFKAANNYDVYDPTTGKVILHCREPKLGIFTKLLRFTDFKRLTPFDTHVTTPDGQPVLRVTRGVALLRSRVSVLSSRDELVGSFEQKLLTLGGKFQVLDARDQPLCMLKGKWTSWDFRFVVEDPAHPKDPSAEVELARVTKKWTGLGKELFTSADNYILQIADDVPPDHSLRLLILAAVICIDMVLKE